MARRDLAALRGGPGRFCAGLVRACLALGLIAGEGVRVRVWILLCGRVGMPTTLRKRTRDL
ncbi:hypothetical protein [Pararhodobacter sp.]|uniref:hypothetical protein n=1 Tax=Pararhodobacter sp. TaxID=2127056 RepID=UPI002AFF62D7|nr:hypothetical protein [Pararhodobacter sp.]